MSETKLLKDRTKMLGEFGSVNGSDKFGFGRAGSDSSLHLGFVGDGTAGQAKNKTSDGPMSQCISGIGGVNVAHKLKKRMRRKRRKRSV